MKSRILVRKDQPESIIQYLNTYDYIDNGINIAKQFNVGYHIAKGPKLSETLESLSEKIPHHEKDGLWRR